MVSPPILDTPLGTVFDFPELGSLLEAFERQLESRVDRMQDRVGQWLDDPTATASAPANAQVESIPSHLADLTRLTHQVRGMADALLSRPCEPAWRDGPTPNRQILIDQVALDALISRFGAAESATRSAEGTTSPEDGTVETYAFEFALDAESSAAASTLTDHRFSIEVTSSDEPPPEMIDLLAARERLRAAGASFELDRTCPSARLRLIVRSRPAG